MLLRLLALIWLIALSACATKYDALRNYSAPDAGFVVASVGKTHDNFMHSTQVYFRKKGTEDLGLLGYSPRALAIVGGTSKDFQTPRGEAAHVAKKLPPGEYEIYDYATMSDYGTSTIWYTNRAPLGIRFLVMTGEVTYLGQYLVGLEFVSTASGKRPV